MNILEETINLEESLQTRIILGLIIFIVIYAVLRQTNILSGNKPVVGIISLVMAILAVRNMSASVIEKIGISSRALGIFFIYLAILLTIIIVVHRKDTTSIIRRAIIFLYAVSFGFVFYQQYNFLTENGKILSWIIAGATILIILLDKYIHKWVRYRFN